MFYLRLCKSPKIDITLAALNSSLALSIVVDFLQNTPQSDLSDLHVLETNCCSGAPFTLIDVGLFSRIQLCNIPSFNLELEQENNQFESSSIGKYFKSWGYMQ